MLVLCASFLRLCLYLWLCCNENQTSFPLRFASLTCVTCYRFMLMFLNSLPPNLLLTLVFSAPQVAPRTFQGFNSSSTSIVLSWDPIPQGQVAGILRNFHISYRPLDTADNTTYNITLPITNLTLEITNLQKYTNYKIVKGKTVKMLKKKKKCQMYVYSGHALSYTKLVHSHATQTEGNKYFK